MNLLKKASRNGTAAFCLLAFLVIAVMAGGCTQPASQQAAPSPVTVSLTDSSHMMITYPGSTATGTLLELEVTVTDSAGKVQTRSIGDRQSTTPLKFGSTLPLTGTFTGKNRVLATAYFMDGSQRTLLDTTV